MKNQGKPGIVKENKFSLCITFSNSCMVVCKVVVPFAVSKCELYHLN